ncbi:MAG: hypothetical protein LQ337_000066 [Flavoplaca oasis]|nr:MAG: hypothetical protein LQ337_000066 [Flavoplaca oasis]
MEESVSNYLYPPQAPSPKRRRINGNHSPSRYSSPDELAASSDHDTPTFHRRTSSKNLSRTSADTQRRSYERSPPEDSPDELDHTIHSFYRGGLRRNLQPTASRHVTPDAPSEISLLTPVQAPASPPTSLPPTTPLPPSINEARYLPYKPKMVLKGHRKGVAAVRFSPKGDKIASCSADATIRIWETSTGSLLHTLQGHLAGISTIAWSPDNRVLASGSDDKSIRLWDTVAGKQYPRQLLGHNNYIYSIAFSPKGNMIVSGSYDEAVFLWDVRSAKQMRSLPAHSDPVGGVDFIRDGTLIVSCAGDGLIRIWDTATGQCLRTLVHEDNAPVSSVCFAPNGKFVLAWTLDSCVRLWNYHEGRCVKTYQGHQNVTYSLSGAFGVYGDEHGEVPLGEKKAFTVSGSETGEIVWWDVVSKEVLQREKAHEDCVLGVDTLAKDGLALMVSCGLDKTIRIWERTPPEPEPEIDNFENGMVGGDGFIGENGVDAETMDTVMKIEVVDSEQVDEAQ